MRVFDKIHKRSFDLSKVKDKLFFEVSIENIGHKEPYYGILSKDQHCIITLQIKKDGDLISSIKFGFWFSQSSLEALKAYIDLYYVRSRGVANLFKQAITEIILESVDCFLLDCSSGYSYEDINDYAFGLGYSPEDADSLVEAYDHCCSMWIQLSNALESLGMDPNESFQQILDMFQERQGYKVDIPRD